MAQLDDVVALHESLDLLADAADLETGLIDLLTDLRRASPSAVGLEVLAVVADQDVRLVRFLPGVRPDDVTTSLRVPLRVDDGTGAVLVGPVRVTFYATRPGAFTDLAADLAHAQGLDPDRLELDRDRPPRTGSDMRGLERLSIIHRAVGVLIARGVDPEAAHAHLTADARAASEPLVDHARRVIEDAVRATGRD